MKRIYTEFIRNTRVLKDAFLSISTLNKFLFLSIFIFLLIIIPFIVNNKQTIQQHAATIDCSGSLQSKIDAATSGSTIDITGCTYSQGATINKPLTLTRGTLNVTAGQKGLTITSDNVTIDGIHIIGPQSKTFNPDEKGINVNTTPSTAVKNLVIKNSEIGNFGYGSIYLQHVENLTVENNKLYDDVYAGIMVMSGIGGKISGNTVERIGVNGAEANENNAYGIVLNRIVTDLTTDPYTSDFTVSGNTITDVPTWHAMDTHAGQRLTFSGNTVYRASRALFITGDSANNRSSDITVTGNFFGSPNPVTFNLVAVTTYNSKNVTITGNTLSAAWPNGAGIYDYQNLSTNLVISNNTVGETPPFTPTPTPTPSANIKSITVSSIASLKTALADNTVDEIVVTNGTYHVSPASDMQGDSLWIGAQFTSRTRPITVRAQTTGGVTFDGGGTTYFGCISFEQGVHDQTWDGFNCAGGEATMTGIVTFAGYPNSGPSYVLPPYNITMRNITILPSCTGNSLIPPYPAHDHAFYISNGGVGPHDLLFNNITVDGSGGLASAFHFYHSDATNQNGSNIKVQNLHVKGTQQAIILWDSTLKNITFDTADIVNPTNYAVRYETTGSTNIVLRNITSNKSFYSSQGLTPIGVSFINDAFNSSVTSTSTPTITPLIKYSCNNSGGCVQSTSGQYSTSSCNNACVLPTPTPTLKATATPAPTATPTSTPTLAPKPGDTLLTLGIGLDGIFNSGTHINPNGGSSTKNPIRKSRVFSVEITGNNIIKSNWGTLDYNPDKGYFAGIINLGSDFISGPYIVKVKTDGYLKSSITGIENITTGQTSSLLPRVNLTAGDINGDNTIDIKDYNILMSCMNSSNIKKSSNGNLCNSAYQALSDLDDNGIVNEFDYNLFLAEYVVQNGD